MTHTPGPWRVHSEHADRIIVNGCCVYQVGNLAVSGSYAPGVLGEPDHDDVRLMAAAPDLFAVLKECESFLTGSREPASGPRRTMLTKVRQVLSNAIGEEEA